MATANANTNNHAPWFNISSELKSTILPELSGREAEILMLYSSGLDARTIANFLNISSYTVNNHLANAKLKFDLNHVSELRAMLLLRFLSCQAINNNSKN